MDPSIVFEFNEAIHASDKLKVILQRKKPSDFDYVDIDCATDFHSDYIRYDFIRDNKIDHVSYEGHSLSSIEKRLHYETNHIIPNFSEDPLTSVTKNQNLETSDGERATSLDNIASVHTYYQKQIEEMQTLLLELQNDNKELKTTVDELVELHKGLKIRYGMCGVDEDHVNEQGCSQERILSSLGPTSTKGNKDRSKVLHNTSCSTSSKALKEEKVSSDSKAKGGLIYKGDFQSAKMHGKGTANYPDGSSYNGNWVNGFKHGYGVLTFANGDVYEGDFFEDLSHGNGKIKWNDGSVYEGQFANGTITGFGKMICEPKDKN